MGEVVARLVAETATASPGPEAGEGGGETVEVFCDYEVHRTSGRFDRRTHRVDVTSGPLSGRSFKSPSGAAIEVVTHYKPTVNPNRNGWSFWVLDDGSGHLLQSLRRPAARGRLPPHPAGAAVTAVRTCTTRTDHIWEER